MPKNLFEATTIFKTLSVDEFYNLNHTKTELKSYPALYYGKNGHIDHHFTVSIDHCKLMINKLSICSYNLDLDVFI